MMRNRSKYRTPMNIAKSRYETATDLVASVETLLTLPDVYLRVKAVVEDPDSYLTDLVNAISVDPGITARLLRLVNSAYINLGVPVDNLRQAVNLLGMKPVHDLVLATTLTSTFARANNSAMDMRNFWIQSVRRAVYARLVAGCCDLKDRERLFVGGLLSDIGHQVMYLQIPKETRAAAQNAVSAGVALAGMESKLLGFNYTDVGAELMRTWDMPDSLAEVVQYHLHPEDSAEFALDAAVVNIANALTFLHEEEFDQDRLLSIVTPGAWQLTELGPEELFPLRDQSANELEEAIGMLLNGDVAA